MTREEWLKKAVRSMRPLLRKAGLTMRAKWQVSVSLASSRSAIEYVTKAVNQERKHSGFSRFQEDRPHA